jgi:hypothetical protein
VNAVAMPSLARYVIATTMASITFKDSTTAMMFIEAKNPPHQPEKGALAVLFRPD